MGTGNRTLVETEKGSKDKDKPGTTKGYKKVQSNRAKWIFVNIKKDHYAVLQEIADKEGRRMNIVSGKEMLRSIVNQICIKYREAKTYEDTVENTFIDMFPTVKHYEELRGIITSNVKDYLKQLQQEQKRRELERDR